MKVSIGALLFMLIEVSQSQRWRGIRPVEWAITLFDSALEGVEIRWLLLLCLPLHLLFLIFEKWRRSICDSNAASCERTRIINGFLANFQIDLCLSATLLFNALGALSGNLQSPCAIALVSGPILGSYLGLLFCLAPTYKNPSGKAAKQTKLILLVIYVSLMLWCSLWSANFSDSSRYRDSLREEGPWNNPNIFGLLMGSGVICTLGWVLDYLGLPSQFIHANRVPPPFGIAKLTLFIISAMVAVFMAVGLVKSYSRGAWVGTCAGAIYIALNLNRKKNGGRDLCKLVDAGDFRLGDYQRWGFLNGGVATICVSFCVILFFHVQYVSINPLRRAFSFCNPLDFSWTNRVEAWKAALQIMADHPFFGTGWKYWYQVYQNFYSDPRTPDVGALETNDMLLLGVTLGIPAILFLTMYFWKIFVGENMEVSDGLTPNLKNGRIVALPGSKNVIFGRVDFADHGHSILLSLTFRAAALVLLVGFCLDGGLLITPISVAFWLLLVSGRPDSCHWIRAEDL